jgi:glyoxylase-like metal-dependent hydrolase (beta-lactamase superfamily II)
LRATGWRADTPPKTFHSVALPDVAPATAQPSSGTPSLRTLAIVPPVVDQLTYGPYATNCYLVRADRSASEAVVVDPSGTAAEIRLTLASLGARCVAILVTHGHIDHILGLADLAEVTEAPVHAPVAERALLERPNEFAPPGLTARACTPSVLLTGGETLDLAGVQFDVVSVPGHSPGHLAYAIDGALLSGDVLFAGSVGRTDLPGGDWETLHGSLRTLVGTYSGETTVYPGHGPPTTLARELASNPFLAELREELEQAAE